MENDKQDLRKNLIGTIKENQLHASLKKWYSIPGDFFEAKVDGYVIDILRGDLLIEIQTGSFSNIRNKLLVLLERHPLRLVLPISRDKWIIKEYTSGGVYKRRKSPHKGRYEDIFYELVRIPKITSHPNFSFEAVLIQEEEVQINDGKGSWRRKGWSIKDRRLLSVLEKREFSCKSDYLDLLPVELASPFTVKELAAQCGISNPLATKTTYCLRHMGAIKWIGKQGRAYLYEKEQL
jgi:hypothetical protein